MHLEISTLMTPDHWFTTGLGIIGLLQFLAFVLQARRLHQTIDAMLAAETRQQTTDHIQLRAWVGIDAVRLNAPNLKAASYTPVDLDEVGGEVADSALFTVRNFGRTPANQVQIVARWFHMPPNQRPASVGNHWRPFKIDADAPVRQTRTKHTIFPDQTKVLELPIANLSSLRAAVAATATTYLYGELSYTDIYAKHGSTLFCFTYFPGRPPGDQFVSYEERNEAK